MMIDLQTKIKNKWKELEKNSKRPSEIKKVKEIEYKEFSQLFENSSFSNLEQLMESFYSGYIYAVKNSFSKEFIEKIKLYLINSYDNTKSTFYRKKI